MCRSAAMASRAWSCGIWLKAKGDSARFMTSRARRVRMEPCKYSAPGKLP